MIFCLSKISTQQAAAGLWNHLSAGTYQGWKFSTCVRCPYCSLKLPWGRDLWWQIAPAETSVWQSAISNTGEAKAHCYSNYHFDFPYFKGSFISATIYLNYKKILNWSQVGENELRFFNFNFYKNINCEIAWNQFCCKMKTSGSSVTLKQTLSVWQIVV